ncbi:MAG: hypothetical protein ACLTBV_18755 [Enterocloster bolteae]
MLDNIPTMEQQLAQLQAENAELTITLADMMRGVSSMISNIQRNIIIRALRIRKEQGKIQRIFWTTYESYEH